MKIENLSAYYSALGERNIFVIKLISLIYKLLTTGLADFLNTLSVWSQLCNDST